MNSDGDFSMILQQDVALEQDLINLYMKYYSSIKDDYLRLKVRELVLAGETQVKIAKDIAEYLRGKTLDLTDLAASYEVGSNISGIPEGIREFSPPDCIIVEMKHQSYNNFIIDSMKHLMEQPDLSCIYVSATKPVVVMKDILAKAGADIDRIQFIECSSAPEMPGSISPSNLTQINIELNNLLKITSGRKIVVFDTLSALQVYNTSQIITDFVNVVSKMAKVSGFGLVWLHIKSDTEPLNPVVQTFVDRTVPY
ncbi:MAG: hypothetical protein V1744_00145 [Candidatus Altiarchaeota archaeon]